MTYKGHVRNGVVVLDEPVTLPEGSIVQVEPVRPADDLETLRDGLRNLAGTVGNLPENLAENHDHYIHGTPRR